MSRIRRLSQVISEEGRRALASQQATKIRDAAFSIVDQANLNASTTRKVTKKAAFTVVLRSLQSTRNLPFSLREHMAIKELSQYITLAQSDKSHSLTLSNTDLLPISHPRSTRNHSMTASALTEARARWIADDPRIVDGYAKTIIASALTSEYLSVEHIYYNSILSNLPQGVVPTEIVIAAGNPFSGGNSSAERSLRARLQRRDREGKFAFMGGGLTALIRKSNGKVYNLVGRPIVDGPNGDDIQMQLPDGKIVNIPASKGMFVKAVINPTPDGFSKDTAKTATTKNIINEEDLVYVDAPQGWKKTGEGAWESNDGNWVITKSKDSKGNDQYEVKDAKSGKTVSTGNGDWEDALDSIAEQADGKKAVLPSDNKNNIVPKKAPVEIGGNGEGPKTPKPFEFNYPEGAVKIKIDESYDPEGRVDEVSPDFTDDPAELAQIFDPRDLVQALEQGVLPENEGDNAIGYGVLRFNGGDEYVPVQAIYNAIGEAGEDAPLELARIYDKGLGGSDNEDALNDNRKGVARLDQAKPDVAESFERTISMSPDEVPATQEPKFDATEMDQVPLPPVLEGLSDGEMKQFMETGDHTPFLPENDSIDMPEGYNTLDPSPFSSWREVTADTPDAILPEGFSDNPVFLAQSIDKQSLEAELRRSIEPNSATPGYANISLQDEDGEDFVANVPGEAVRDALQLQGVDTNELIKSIADEGFAGQKDEPVAELPLDIPAEPKPMNAYERLMAENKAAADAVIERRAKLDKDAQDRVDEQGRSIPEGWGITLKSRPNFGQLDRPDNYFNVYGNNTFEASINAEGKITVKDRNGLLADKSYDNWEDLQADLPNQQSEYSSAARARVAEIAKQYGYSDEQIASFDSMSQQELADFFANPDNQTEAHNRALDDLNTSWAVDLPRKDQKERWAEIRKNENILKQAGDAPSAEKVAEIPSAADAPNEINDEALLDRRLAGESLDSVAEDLGISREEVRRREMDALRKRREANPELPPTPEGLDKPENKEAVAAFNREYVKELLDQEEALADKYQAEEDMPRGDAQAVAEAEMKKMYGKTAAEALGELPRDEALKALKEREDKIGEEVVPDISEPPTQSDVVTAIDVNSPNLQEEIQSAIDKGQKIAFSYNGKERVVLPKGIWTNPKNGNVNLRAIEDGTDGGLKVFTLDKMEMAKDITPPPAKSKPKELSEGDKAVIKNNAFVEENAGSLQPIEAKDVQVGDFIWNAFHGRYEEVLSNKYAGVMNRMEMEVFNVKNGKKEIRYFEMDSPLRNVRRPGVEDQAEPIPSAKAAPRGGKRNVIKRKAPSERIVAKEGRRMGGNFENEGFYKDMNGVALVPGDVVMHKDPIKGGKWKRGVVKLRIGAQVEEGKKAGAVGRKEVAYLDYLIVQWEGEDDKYALNQGGRQVKAKNLAKFDGSVDGMAMPEFRGGNVKPNAPANPAPANPAAEQGRLLDTPAVKPAAPAAPNMPKPVYNAEVQDQKGNKFKISVVKIDDMYEAAVFNEDGKLSAVIAKNISFGEVQGVIGKFIGDVADSSDGEKVLRVYGDLPEPAEQLVLTGDTPDVPPLPAVKAIELKEAKVRAKALAAAIQDKELPGDARKDLSENEQLRMKSYIQQYLSPSGVDRRQNGKLNDELRVAYRYAVRLGWFDEAQQIAALQKRVDKLPLREGSPEFPNKIADVKAMHPELFGMELELAKRLDYNGRKKVESLMNALNDIIIYPDVYNPNFRGAVIRGRGDIDAILASIDKPNPAPADAEIIDKMKELKKRFDAIGDLPKLPSREKGNDDAQNHLADVAREFEGLSIDDLQNGHGDWKLEKRLTAGINKVYLLRNALTGERIVVKYDNDGNRGNFKGNGIKAEEMVAGLYRELGFAQPAFVAVNPDNPNMEVGGVGVMQYADAGFFGLVNIEVHNKSGVYSLDAVAPEHQAELLNFLVANAIIGNSDRHGGNFMWGTDPATGKARLVPIDNGLAIFNGAFGKPEENQNDPLHLNPLKVITGNYGNFNQVGKLGKKYINGIGEQAAVSQVVEFATRMRERAEAMKFVDPRANEYLMARADFILQNPQKFVDTVLRFW